MTTPETPASIDADIAAFLAEGNKPDDTPLLDAPADATKVEDDEPSSTADTSEGDGDDSGDDGEAEEEPAFKVDAAKLAEAVEKKDLSALLEAMGPAAEEMLTSKAHVTLRLQEKELRKGQKALSDGESKLKDTTIKLSERYRDPITARKAVEAGDVDTFIETVESWSGGHSWNDLITWVGKGLAGRTERLEAKAKDDQKTATEDQTKREKALAETKTWISTSLEKSHASVLKDLPDVVDMVLAELRDGVAKGIDTPLKAMPLVMKKLQQRHEALAKLFATKTKQKKPTSPPSSKVGREEGTKKETRELSLEESIAKFVKENPRR